MVKPRIPELETCFGCCSLRTGSLIIAAVSMVLAAILATTLSILVIYTAVERVTGNDSSLTFDGKFVILVIVMALVACVLFEIVSIFLWLGIQQYKETYVLSWAITITAFNLIQTIVLVFAFLLPTLNSFHYIRDTIFLLETCAIFYVALVVYSYYREIRRLKNAPQSFSNEA